MKKVKGFNLGHMVHGDYREITVPEGSQILDVSNSPNGVWVSFLCPELGALHTVKTVVAMQGGMPLAEDRRFVFVGRVGQFGHLFFFELL